MLEDRQYKETGTRALAVRPKNQYRVAAPVMVVAP